jgi:hypothetical protein
MRQAPSAAGKLLHHEAGAAAGDVRHDGGSTMDFRDQSQVDGESQLHLLPFAQPEIFSLDEYAIGAQVLGLANAALPAGHHHVHSRARAVSGVQATLHPVVLFG